ncbi:MAG: cytochrome c oxidase subunit II [Ardenticatenaceae bacterium]|nr:cytochrome c oxidase subunit II [Ardenticatenaceae bacterium]
MGSRTRHFAIITVLIAVSTVVVYFLINLYLFERPFGASAEASQIETMFQAHFILMGFLFAIIVVPLGYAIVVFRQKEGDDTDAPHIHGNTTLEIVWTIIPVLIVVGFAIWGSFFYWDLVSANEGEVEIRVQGYKWDWTFYYPEHSVPGEPPRQDQTLVVETGQPVVLTMQANDVIHAFWVPQFRVKQDVVPYNIAIRSDNGDRQVIDLSFANPNYEEAAEAFNYSPQEVRIIPDQPGVYRLRCAEICGTQHWAMLANVIVLDTDDYQAWVNGELTLPADPNFANGTPDTEGYYLDELKAFCDEQEFSGVNCESEY